MTQIRKNDHIIEELILTPVKRGENIAKLFGYRAYGIFKTLEARRIIDLDYLSTFDIRGIYDDSPKPDDLLLVYVLLFGHDRAFNVECNDPEFFATILLKAISSREGGVCIHNFLCKMGCYED